ncbi:unnamed protein product [Schistocephalus solidus]|uniref:LYR motif-containing protein 9 n=1 Tax=Schistocephalus solidus TaxID=70667 RepID=A0A183TFP0_SCHSO|nr:unnamed protein product [Schistocephalus solidus]
MAQQLPKTALQLYAYLLRRTRFLPESVQPFYRNQIRQHFKSHADEDDPKTLRIMMAQGISDMDWLVAKVVMNVKKEPGDLVQLRSKQLRRRNWKTALDANCRTHAAMWGTDANPQVAANSARTGHKFKFSEPELLARSDYRVSRELLDSWFTGAQSINKSYDLPNPYSVLRLSLARTIGHSGRAQANTFSNADAGEPVGRAIITPPCNTVY